MGFEGVSSLFIQKKRLDHRFLLMGLVFFMIYVPLYAERWLYFGYPFPNTYYTKTGGGVHQLLGGIRYLTLSMFYIFAGFGVPLFMLLWKGRKIHWREKFSLERMYILILMLASWGMIVINGGDHFGYGRFLMPSTPFLFILILSVGFSEFFEGAKIPRPIRPMFLLVTLFVALFQWQPWTLVTAKQVNHLPEADSTRFDYFLNFDIGFMVMGKTLRERVPQTETIAVVPVGAIGYYSDLNVIDMVGLVDPFIAHQPFDPHYIETWRPGHDKGDGAYVLQQKPDFIQLIDRLTTQPLPGLDEYAQQFKSLNEIWATPEFHTAYKFFPLQTTGGWYYNLYCRVDNVNCTEDALVP